MERCSNESVFFSYLISLQSSGSPEALSTFSAVHNRGGPLKQKMSEDLEKSITVRAINFSPSEYITYPDLLSWPSVLEQTLCPTERDCVAQMLCNRIWDVNPFQIQSQSEGSRNIWWQLGKLCQ